MTQGVDNGGPETGSVRQAARQRATQLKQAQRRKDLIGRSLLIAAGLIVVAAVVVGVTVSLNSTEPSPADGPRNMASHGVVIGKDLEALETPATPKNDAAVPTPLNPAVPNIRVYLDYLDPAVGEFQKANGDLIEGFVKEGVATVEYHPVALLTGKSAGSQYSLRAAASAGCVAQYSPHQFFAYNAALLADQPTEGTAGFSNDELVRLAGEAGADGNELSACIEKGSFKGWAAAVTERALNEPIPLSKLDRLKGTPTVIVNDKVYTGAPSDAKEFRAFVLSVASEAQNIASATPAPVEEAPAEEAPAEEQPAEEQPAP